MIAKEKNIGRRVRWQPHGTRKEKIGRILGICPEKAVPRIFAQLEYPRHKIKVAAMTPATQYTRRYFVEVRDENRKPLIYYPQFANLIIDDEAPSSRA